MKAVKVFFLGLLFLGSSVLIIKTAKIISIPQDPPDGKAYADFFPRPGWPFPWIKPPVAQVIQDKGPCPFGNPKIPSFAGKKPNYFPPFPPPVEYQSTLVLAAKTKGDKKGGAASSG